MKQRKPSKVENDLHETGIFVFLTLVIFFGAVGFPTLINTSPSFGYEGIEFTPVTTAWQEAYAEQQVMETLALYNYNPLLYSAWLVMPNMLDNPPDFTTLLANSYTNNEWKIETGIIEFETIKELITPKINELLNFKILPSAYADTVFSDDFSVDPASNGWTESAIAEQCDAFPVTATGTITSNGSVAILEKTGLVGAINLTISKTFDLTGFSGNAVNITGFQSSDFYDVTCGTSAPDPALYIGIEVDTGSGFVEIYRDTGFYDGAPPDATGADNGNEVNTPTGNIALGSSADNNPSVVIKIIHVTSAVNQDFFLDNFEINNNTINTFNQTITDTATVSDQVTVTKFAVDTTGLEIYWKFDETSGGFKNSDITNIFPDGNSTTETGTFLKSETGIIGTAWKSPASGNTIKVLTGGTPSDYDFMVDGNSTFNMWIKDDSCSVGGFAIQWTTFDNSIADGANTQTESCGTNDIMRVRYFESVGNDNVEEVSPNGYYESDANTFDMYTVVHDNTNDLLLWFKNGVLLATNTTSNDDMSGVVTDNTPILWNSADFNVAYNNGTFDEFSFWSRALSTTDVTSLYNSGLGLELENQTLAPIFDQTITDAVPVVDDVTTEFIPAPVFNVTITDTAIVSDQITLTKFAVESDTATVSDEVNTTFIPAPPLPPTNVSSAQNGTDITITWTKEATADGYKILRKATNDTTSKVKGEDLPNDYLKLNDKPVGDVEIGGNRNTGSVTFSDFICGGAQPCGRAQNFTMTNEDFTLDKIRLKIIGTGWTSGTSVLKVAVFNGSSASLNEILENSTDIFTSTIGSNPFPSGSYHDFEFDDFVLLANKTYMVGAYTNGSIGGSINMFRDDTAFGFTSYATNFDNGELVFENGGDLTAWSRFNTLNLQIDLIGDQFEEIATVGDVDEFTDVLSSEDEGNLFFYKIKSLTGSIEGNASSIVNQTAPLISGSDLFNSTSKIWQFREHDLELSHLEGASGAGCLSNCGSGGKFPNANVSIGAQEGRTTASNGESLPSDLLNINTGVSGTGGDSQNNDRGAGIIHFFKIFNTTEITDSSITIAWQQEANGGLSGDAGLTSVATLSVFDGIINKDSGFNFAHDIPVVSNVDGVRTDISGSGLSGIQGASVGAGIGDFNMTIQTLNASSINWGSFNSSFATVVVSMIDPDSAPVGSNSGSYELFIANITVSKIGTWNFTNPQIIYTVDGNRQLAVDVCPKRCMDSQKGFIGERGFVNTTSFALPSVPDQVTGLTVIQNMTNNAELDWDDASGADNYQVFRGSEIEWQVREHNFHGTHLPTFEAQYDFGASVNNTFTMSSSGSLVLESNAGLSNGQGYLYKTFQKSFIEGKDLILESQSYCSSGACTNQKPSLVVTDGSWEGNEATVLPLDALGTTLGKGTIGSAIKPSPVSPSAGIANLTLTASAMNFTDSLSQVTIYVIAPDGSTGISAQEEIYRIILGNSTTGQTIFNFSNPIISFTPLLFPPVANANQNTTLTIEQPQTLIGSPIESEFTDTTISPLTSILNYTVRGNNTAGFGLNSTIVQFGLIQPIAGLTANATNSTTIKLSWNQASTVHPSDPLTGVIIQRSNATGFEIQEWELKEQDHYTGANCFSEPSFIVEYQSGVISSVGLFIINNSLAVAQGNADTAEDLLKLQHAHPTAICPQGQADPSRGDFYLFKVFDKADLPTTGNITVIWGGYDNYFVCETAFPLACVSAPASTSTLTLQVRDGLLDRFDVTDFPANPATSPTGTGTGVPLKGSGILTSLSGGFSQRFSGQPPPFGAFIHSNTTSYDLSSSILDNVTLNLLIPDSSAFDSPTILLESIEIEDFGIWDFQRKSGTDILGNGIINFTADLQQDGLGGMDDGNMIAQFTCTKTVGDCDFGASVSLQGTGESNFTTIATVDELDTMFNDTGLDEDTSYVYRAKGESAVSTGAFDIIASATTPSVPDLNKTATDTATVSDQEEFDITKLFTDTATVSDNVNATIIPAPFFNQTEIDTVTVSDQTDVTAIISQFVSDIVTAIDNLDATTGKSSSDTATTSDQQFITSPPFPITTLSASTVGNTCELSWSAPPNGNSPIIKYQIFRAVSSGAFSLLLNQTFVNHTDTGLINNVLYEYNVTSINAFGDSEPSNIENCMPIVSTVPNAPSLTDVNEEPNGDVTIDWIASTEGSPTGYKIERKVGGGGFLVLVANTGNSLVTFTDTTTSPATQFTYRISGINAFGTGAPSNEGSITTASPPNAPLLSGAQNGDQIDISWTTPASANPITGYKIDRRINLGAFTTLIANTTNTDLNFTDSNVTKPDTFGYRVRALSSAGEGTVSNIVDITFGSHLIVKVREQDGSFFKGGGIVKGVNSTIIQLVGLDVNSNAIFDNLDVGNFNFTFTDADDFILNKTFNILAPAGNDTSEFTINALVFDVDCPTNGAGTDIRIKVNYTDVKDITEFPSSPVCDSSDQVSWSTRWQGSAVNDTSTMVADFISTIFKANAEQFLASADVVPTSYNSGLNKITSETYVVNMTDTTINFNLFLGRAPAGGGGGGSGSQPTPQITIPDPDVVFADRLTGLSILSRTHQFAQAGDIIEGTITVNWEGEDNLTVKGINIANTDLDVRFDLTPFPLEQKVDGIGEFAMSSAEIPYTIVLALNECNVEIGLTQNCFDPILHTLPVEFTFGLGEQEYQASTEIFVDGRPIPIDIVQLQIILLFLVLVVSAVFGNIIRNRFKKGKSRNIKAKKKFKKKFDAS